MLFRVGLRVGGSLGYLEGNTADFGVRLREKALGQWMQHLRSGLEEVIPQGSSAMCAFSVWGQELTSRLKMVELQFLRSALVGRGWGTLLFGLTQQCSSSGEHAEHLFLCTADS